MHMLRWGIPEPPPDGREKLETFRDLDTLIVPGVGFSASMDRLGQGGGFYDRYLNTWSLISPHTIPTTIGIAYDSQLVSSIPVGEFDRKLNHIVLPSGVYDL